MILNTECKMKEIEKLFETAKATIIRHDMSDFFQPTMKVPLLSLLLFTLLLTGCGRWKNQVEYNGQILSRCLTMVSEHTDSTGTAKDTISYYFNSDGMPYMINDEPLYVKRSADTLFAIDDILTHRQGIDTTFALRILRHGLIWHNKSNRFTDYDFRYDDHNRLIEAISSWTDTYRYKFIWKEDLLTDIVAVGGYKEDSIVTHVEYDLTKHAPIAGLPALMETAPSLFWSPTANVYLLTGHMGKFPNHQWLKLRLREDGCFTRRSFPLRTMPLIPDSTEKTGS